jgi:hypothetical protein
MNPTRFLYGVLLFTLCVFGLPEGCLVFASHTAAPPIPVEDTDIPVAPEPLEKGSALTYSARNAE